MTKSSKTKLAFYTAALVLICSISIPQLAAGFGSVLFEYQQKFSVVTSDGNVSWDVWQWERQTNGFTRLDHAQVGIRTSSKVTVAGPASDWNVLATYNIGEGEFQGSAPILVSSADF